MTDLRQAAQAALEILPQTHPVSKRLRAALAAQQAKCSPTLTECPRCKNNFSKCDGIAQQTAQPVTLTGDEKAALDRALLRSVKIVGEAAQPQQDELQQAKARIDRLETEMRKLRGNLRGVFDRELWDSLDTRPQQAPCDPSCLVAAGGTQDDYCVLTLGECARKKSSST